MKYIFYETKEFLEVKSLTCQNTDILLNGNLSLFFLTEGEFLSLRKVGRGIADLFLN